MNDENLLKGKATQFKAGEEQARIAKKGWTKSAEVRRERKRQQQLILDLLNTDFAGKTVFERMIGGLAKRAIEGGDQAAFEKLMEYAGTSVRLELLQEDRRLKREALELQKKQTGSATASEDKPDPRSDILEQIRKAMEPTDGGNTDL